MKKSTYERSTSTCVGGMRVCTQHERLLNILRGMQRRREEVVRAQGVYMLFIVAEKNEMVVSKLF